MRRCSAPWPIARNSVSSLRDRLVGGKTKPNTKIGRTYPRAPGEAWSVVGGGGRLRQGKRKKARGKMEVRQAGNGHWCSTEANRSHRRFDHAVLSPITQNADGNRGIERTNASRSGIVQSKVTPTIVAGVCDPGVDNCRPRRDRLQADNCRLRRDRLQADNCRPRRYRLQADNCRPRRDRLQAGPITACAMIPSVTQERVFLNHAASQVAGIPQRVVGEAIGTRNRNELHLTHVDGFNGAKRARSGTHGADRDRDSAPDAGSRGRRDDLPSARRRAREIRRAATLCDMMRHCRKQW